MFREITAIERRRALRRGRAHLVSRPKALSTVTTPRVASDNGVFSTNRVFHTRSACSDLFILQNCSAYVISERKVSAIR